MKGKVNCTCGWSWNKSDSSAKDMYVCHECGRDNSNNIPKAQVGIQTMSSRDKRGVELLLKETENAKKDKQELQTTGQIKNPKSIEYKKQKKELDKKKTYVTQDNRTDYEREYDREKGQAKEDKKQLKKNIIAPLDVATDIMQLGNFVPNPIGQGIGKIGNILGAGIDAYQAYDALSEGEYADAAINAGSVFLPLGLDAKTFRRSSKYLQPGQPLYPLSPQANLPANATISQKLNIPDKKYIEPFTKVQGMTDTSLLANRALLGTLGAETVYDTFGGSSESNDTPSIQYYNTDPKKGEVEKPGQSSNVQYVPISNSEELKRWKQQNSKSSQESIKIPQGKDIYAFEGKKGVVAKNGGWLDNYDKAQDGEVVYTPPKSQYKRLYGHATDYSQGKKPNLRIDPDTGYGYFPQELSTVQQKEVPNNPWNITRFLFDPLVINASQGIHNSKYDKEGNIINIPGKDVYEEGRLTDGLSRKERYDAAKKDITSYYKEDLKQNDDAVEKNVDDTMDLIRKMRRTEEMMQRHNAHYKDLQNPEEVFRSAVGFNELFPIKSMKGDFKINPRQAKRAYKMFQKTWRGVSGKEARQNSREELKKAQEAFELTKEQKKESLLNPIKPNPNYVPENFANGGTLKNGGWLDNYNDSQASAPEGMVGDGYSNVGRDYSPAWGGQFQEGGKLKFLQPTSDKLPEGYRIPFSDPSTERAGSIGGENGEPAYLIPEFKYGRPIYDSIEEFKRTGEHLGGPFKTWQEADEWENTVRHPAVEKGETIMFPQEQFQTGGSLPGSVGFTYARTKGIPSEGPYAKKTMPSAKDGGWLDKHDVAQNGKKKFKLKDERLQAIKPSESTFVKKPNFDAEQAKVQKTYVNQVGKQMAEEKRRAKLTKDQREREDYNARNEERGSIQSPVEESTWDRTKAIVSNPLTAFGYAARNESLPTRFQFGPRNEHDYALDWVNPLQGAVALSEIPGELGRGEYLNAGLSALDAADLGVYARGAMKASKPLLQKGVQQLGNVRTSIAPELRQGLQTNGFLDIFKNTKKEGVEWLKNWHNDPITIEKIKDLQKYDDVVNQSTGVKYSNYVHGNKRWSPEDVNRIKYPKSDSFTESYSNWDKLDPQGNIIYGDTQVGKLEGKSSTIHEGSHQLTNNGGFYNKYTEDLLQQGFKNNLDEILPEHTGGYGKSYFVKPTEIHARINEIRNSLNLKPSDIVTQDMLDKLSKKFMPGGGDLLTHVKNKKLFLETLNKFPTLVPGAIGLGALGSMEKQKDGGIIKDDRGQWDHPGEITEIGSNEITMEGVPYDVLGISDEGDTKLMKPGKNYKFKGKKVTEFPMAKNGMRQEQKGLQNLDNLVNFTNYNKPQPGGWLNKYN